jgi:hypothetical protein
MQYLGGTADGADLHDGVENFNVAQTHRFYPRKKGPRTRRGTSKDIGKLAR